MAGRELYSGAICSVIDDCGYNLMRCLYSRFKRYPNSVTKVLQTLLRYLDTRESLKRGNPRKYLTGPELNSVALASRRLSSGSRPQRQFNRMRQ